MGDRRRKKNVYIPLTDGCYKKEYFATLLTDNICKFELVTVNEA